MTHEMIIACSPSVLFDYVTQPWRWHEWHPSSLSASAEKERLQEGDAFDEMIEVRPLSPLPLRLRRSTRYRVLRSIRGQEWEVQGQMRDGWLRIHYSFIAVPEGTLFRRQLTFDVGGASRLLRPLLKTRMASLSVLALENLKRHMEEGQMAAA